MKKTLLIIALTSVSFMAMAQDTLTMKDLRQMWNYLFLDSVPGDTTIFHPMYYAGVENGGETARFHYTKDSLTIYGIAAAIKVLNYTYYPGYFYDTTDEYVYEYLRLYDPCPDSLYCMRQAKVHPNHTPIAYYLDLYQESAPWMTRKYIPVYECYFRPMTVVDSFYVGMTHWTKLPYVDSAGNFYIQRTTHYLTILDLGMPVGYEVEQWFMCFYYPAPRKWIRKSYRQAYTVIFPILTPNPDTTATGDTLVIGNDTIAMGDTLIVCDTTIVGGDTIVNYDTILTIGHADLLQRFTGVMPNPAAEKARVVSSFGMSMVKVYNAGGALVLSQRADGLHVDIDVSRWPAGTYLVRIHTPQGVAVKKLVVSR